MKINRLRLGEEIEKQFVVDNCWVCSLKWRQIIIWKCQMLGIPDSSRCYRLFLQSNFWTSSNWKIEAFHKT
jgi:hypothetical protein